MTSLAQAGLGSVAGLDTGFITTLLADGSMGGSSGLFGVSRQSLSLA